MIYYQQLQTYIHPSLADYSILISNLPQATDLVKLQTDLSEFFDQLNNHNGISYFVDQITFLFDTHRYLLLCDKLDSLKRKMLAIKEESFFNLSASKEAVSITRQVTLKQQISDLQSEINILENEYSNAIIQGSITGLFVGKAIVTFKEQIAALDILEKYNYEEPIFYKFLLCIIGFFRNACSDSRQKHS